MDTQIQPSVFVGYCESMGEEQYTDAITGSENIGQQVIDPAADPLNDCKELQRAKHDPQNKMGLLICTLVGCGRLSDCATEADAALFMAFGELRNCLKTGLYSTPITEAVEDALVTLLRKTKAIGGGTQPAELFKQCEDLSAFCTSFADKCTALPLRRHLKQSGLLLLLFCEYGRLSGFTVDPDRLFSIFT